MTPPAIAIDDVTLGYDGHPAVHHLSGSFAPGSLTAVVGPNGSGKSTLLKGIMGMLPTLGGTIALPQRDIAYLPQRADLDREFPACVTDLVMLGLWAERGNFAGIGGSDRQRIAAALATVGLEGYGRRGLDTLSGGQLQRTLFARLLLQDAAVILLDEPFTGIDESTVADLMRLVEGWHADGRTVIAVLHDLDLVRRHFPKTLLLAREPIGWGATEEVLSPDNLKRARHMPAAWDEHAPWHDGQTPPATGHDHHAGHAH